MDPLFPGPRKMPRPIPTDTRRERALNVLLAVAIGISLAAVVFFGASS